VVLLGVSHTVFVPMRRRAGCKHARLLLSRYAHGIANKSVDLLGLFLLTGRAYELGAGALAAGLEVPGLRLERQDSSLLGARLAESVEGEDVLEEGLGELA
jgi:hypothetical protein